MNEIKQKLKNLAKNSIVEIEFSLEDLYSLLEDKTAKDEDIKRMQNMESYLVELENVLLVIKEDKLDDKKALEVYESISNFLNHDHE